MTQTELKEKIYATLIELESALKKRETYEKSITEVSQKLGLLIGTSIGNKVEDIRNAAYVKIGQIHATEMKSEG